MGDINQLLFIQEHASHFTGPFLEVGSKDYGSTQDLRTLFADRGKYVGLDMEDGPGVDVVLDLTAEFDRIDEQLGHVRFGTIFCLSVLEHCSQPFKFAENTTKLLKTQGQLCISVPFAWQYHGYPSDYWRFTQDGVRILFPDLKFDFAEGVSATSRMKEFKKLNQDVGKIPFSFNKHRKEGHPFRGIEAKLLKLLSKIGILTWLSGYRYVMAPTSIFLIGTRQDS